MKQNEKNKPFIATSDGALLGDTKEAATSNRAYPCSTRCASRGRTHDLGGAQFFLKWVISHPAITCAISATSNPAHQTENIGALKGDLPDKAMQARMVKYMGFN